MASLALACRVATTFTKSGEIDEDAQRKYLQRFIDTGIEVYVASGGSGEGHALKWEELRQIYRICVEYCKGKIPVHSNQPEHYTARATIDHAKLAIECGVEIVNLYGPAGWHGYRPTDEEYVAYHDHVLGAIKHPVAVAPNPTQGYRPAPELVASICNKYAQVMAVNLVNLDENYFIDLKNALKRNVALYVPLRGSLNTFTLGAAGLVGGQLNLTPRTYRRYVDLYETRKLDEMGKVFADLMRTNQYCKPWDKISGRQVKMFMHVLKLPGWEGGLREPCRIPPAAEMKRFADGLLALRVPEIDEMARAAGLSVPE